MINHEVLKNEILTDPENLGYKNEDGSIKSKYEILSLLNTPSDTYVIRPNTGKVPIYIILNYLAGCSSGALAKIWDLSDNKESPYRSVALAFRIWITGAAENGNFDLDSAPIQGAITAFVALSIMTQEEANGLLALANVKLSRSQYLFGDNCTDMDLRNAALL